MSLRIAFASSDRLHVNQHFGSAEGFFIYDVVPDKASLVAVGEFPAAAMDGNEDNTPASAGNPAECNHSRWTPEGRHKLAAKIDFLDGCAAVFVMAVGGSAIKQLMASGVQPVRVTEVGRIGDLLAEIQGGMRSGGVPWIDKALAALRNPQRFAAMADESWVE